MLTNKLPGASVRRSSLGLTLGASERKGVGLNDGEAVEGVCIMGASVRGSSLGLMLGAFEATGVGLNDGGAVEGACVKGGDNGELFGWLVVGPAVAGETVVSMKDGVDEGTVVGTWVNIDGMGLGSRLWGALVVGTDVLSVGSNVAGTGQKMLINIQKHS
jgi:hypothetical protein